MCIVSMESKLQQRIDWLASNPNKTDLDWLLEERCSNDSDRNAMRNLLSALDQNCVTYGICVEVKNWYTKYQSAPINAVERVFFDVAILPGIGRNSYLIEVDMPDNVLGAMVWCTDRKANVFPESGYRWLLSKWCPSFNIDTLSDREYSKLMREDMAGFLSGIIGPRGFPNWKTPRFAEKVVAQYISDKQRFGQL